MENHSSHPDVWLNGGIVPWADATVHMFEVGVSSSEEVHEGIRAYWNPELEQLFLFRPQEHMQRLADSMKLVELQRAFSIEELTAAAIDLLKHNQVREDAYIHVKSFPRGGQFFVLAGRATTDVFMHNLPFPSQLGAGGSLACCVSSWTRIADNVMPPRVKCASNYRNSLLAVKEARRNGYDDAILLNGQGKVAEASVAALFMIRGGAAVTPPATSGMLESITRQTLIDLFGQSLGVRVVERDIDRTELYLADEVFCCGTGREIRAITSVDRFPVGAGEPGPVTRQIEALYHDIVRGRRPEHRDWCVPVWPLA